MAENLVPLTEDLTLEQNLLDITRGLEKIIRVDKTIASGATLFAEGDWAVLNDSDELVDPTVTSAQATFPVWAGDSEGRSDVHATGKATIIMGGDFVYKTTKYDTGGSYNVGDPLTVKDLGGGEKVPTNCASTEYIHAVVTKVPAGGIMEVMVVANPTILA